MWQSILKKVYGLSSWFFCGPSYMSWLSLTAISFNISWIFLKKIGFLCVTFFLGHPVEGTISRLGSLIFSVLGYVMLFHKTSVNICVVLRVNVCLIRCHILWGYFQFCLMSVYELLLFVQSSAFWQKLPVWKYIPLPNWSKCQIMAYIWYSIKDRGSGGWLQNCMVLKNENM